MERISFTDVPCNTQVNLNAKIHKNVKILVNKPMTLFISAADDGDSGIILLENYDYPNNAYPIWLSQSFEINMGDRSVANDGLLEGFHFHIINWQMMGVHLFFTYSPTL